MLAERILKGDVRSASRLMRWIDDRDPGAIPELQALFSRTGRARIVGITGSPGTGKSTLTDTLIGAYRRQGKTVGVVAVDPTSPFTGGALLGDRIRMQDHATDPGVFIRSLATRGALGGLSRASSDVVRVLDAMGKDVILVETVGVGQDEVDVARLAHTTIVVLVPGMGDDVQAIKAGILEVADVFAVNKADHEGADRTVRELRMMLELRHAVGPKAAPAAHSAAAVGLAPVEEGWEPPIVKTVATRAEGLADLVTAIEGHGARLHASGELSTREVARARAEFVALLRERLLEGALAALAQVGTLDEIASRIARREQDPYVLGDELARTLGERPLRPNGHGSQG
jgi:LAO/AO transport system kinase